MRNRFTATISLLFLLTLCVPTVNSQELIRGADVDRRVIHPIVKVFNPSELALIRRSAAVVISPLDFERRLGQIWVMGKREAENELSQQGGDAIARAERILQRNRQNQLQLTPQQLQEHLALVYQLGGLYAINQFVNRTLATPAALPRLRSATRREIREMQRRRADAVRMLSRQLKTYRGMTDGEAAAEVDLLEEEPEVREVMEEVDPLQAMSVSAAESESDSDVQEEATAADSALVNDASPESNSEPSEFSTQQFFFGTPYFGFGVGPFGYFGYSPGFWGRGWRGGWGRGGWWRRRRWRRFFW